MRKIIAEVDLWFLSLEIDKVCDLRVIVGQEKEVKRWRPPPEPWLKCNIGCYWSNHNHMGGMAWVLRDPVGKVLLHSRRTFVNVRSKLECSFKGMEWAVESMLSHGFKQVLFSLEDAVVVGALNRPRAWPSFRLQSSDLWHVLASFRFWKVELESHCANRGAFLIARSVIKDLSLQSYVAAGPPFWLSDIFDSEKISPSV